METILCKSCGRPILETCKICPYCGNIRSSFMNDTTIHHEIGTTDQNSVPLKQGSNETIVYNNSPYNQPSTKQNSRQSLIRIISLLALFLIGLLLFVLYMNKQKDKEVEAERQKTKQVQMKMEKLQKDTEQVKQQTDSLIAAGETKRLEDSIKAAQTRKAEKMAREQAAREEAALMAMPKSLDGSHYLKGTVKSKKGDKYWFKLWLEIEDGDVSGSFKTSANEGPVNGHVDSSGNMVVYELDYDYDATGYYWSGKFNGKSYSGNYYSDWGFGILSFWTN